MKKFCKIVLIVLVSLSVNGCVSDVVQFDTNLSETDMRLKKDETVKLSVITGGKVVRNEPGCLCDHLHAVDPFGILIHYEGEIPKGPYPDPNPTGCGYGCIFQVPVIYENP